MRRDDVNSTIIRRCQRGDIRALETIYRTYSKRVYRLCLRMAGDTGIAEDLLQEVFIRAYEQIGKYSGRASFSTWLYRVATNHCLNVLKSQRQLPSLEGLPDNTLPSDPSPSPLARSIDEEEFRLALRLLEQLGPDERAILVLREIEGLSYRQISFVLDIAAGTVMSRLHRARQCLEELAHPDGLFLAESRIKEDDGLSKSSGVSE